MKKLRSMLLVAALALPLAAIDARPALAQPAQPLPAPLASSDSLSDEQRAQIQAFVQARSAGLTATDASEFRRNRDEVLKPLQQRVSVTFRLEYSKHLGPILETMAAGQNDQQVINALRLAGELAAPRSISILTKALADDRAPVRYAASFGIARFFDAVGRSGSAASVEQLSEMLRAVSTRVASESDPFVVDGLVLAIAAAARVPESAVKELRSPAIAQLAKVTQALAPAPAPDVAARRVETLFRACATMRTALTDIQQTPLSGDVKSACAGAGKAIIAGGEQYASIAAQGAGLDSAQVTQLQAAAKAVLGFAEGK